MAGAVRGGQPFHRGSLKIFRWTLPVPPFRLTVYQIAIASADMLVAGSVLYILFPPVRGGYLTVLEVYLVAYVLIVLSHVPGGWGVLEAVHDGFAGNIATGARPASEHAQGVCRHHRFPRDLLPLPLLFAAVMVGWHEYALRKKWIPPLVAVPTATADEAAQLEGTNGHAGKNGSRRQEWNQ